jgi:hypothetical protein
MEPLDLYHKLEAFYERAWRFQLQHGSRLERSERGWLAYVLQETTTDLEKLKAALDLPPPFVRKARPDDSPEVVLRLAGRYSCLAEVQGRLAEHQQWLGERWAALAERDWQAAEALRRRGRGFPGAAEEAGGRSPSGRTPEPSNLS